MGNNKKEELNKLAIQLAETSKKVEIFFKASIDSIIIMGKMLEKIIHKSYLESLRKAYIQLNYPGGKKVKHFLKWTKKWGGEIE